jgi:hypothetical protein
MQFQALPGTTRGAGSHGKSHSVCLAPVPVQRAYAKVGIPHAANPNKLPSGSLVRKGGAHRHQLLRT